MTVLKPRRALISVSDKQGIVDFSRALTAKGVQILSTGGTASLLTENGIEVTAVSDYTGFPELMGGRLKTLHPKIHGGILSRPDVDRDEMQDNDIYPIDLVVANLYPFESVTANPNTSLETAIENIDIGGPAMIRAAAKNFAHTAVVVEPNDYIALLTEMEECGGIRGETRMQLAIKAYERTSQYDAVISSYLSTVKFGSESFPDALNLSFTKQMEMRYGENPHQSAAFYLATNDESSWLQQAKMHQGKPLSFNNVADVDAAYNCVAEFTEPTCVIIKHATPCGVASAIDVAKAYELAYQTDPTSAFGGVIAINRPLDGPTAELILKNQFVEPNIRMLEHAKAYSEPPNLRLSTACGGLLVQSPDTRLLAGTEPEVVSHRVPSNEERSDLMFAWTVAKHVKSNAIVYARAESTIGIGAGQMSRVDSAKIAASKAADAGLEISGAVMASDAFFPFRDSIDTAAKSGITAIIQPGGSLRDSEVIEAANEHGIAMLFTGMRHFRH